MNGDAFGETYGILTTAHAARKAKTAFLRLIPGKYIHPPAKTGKHPHSIPNRYPHTQIPALFGLQTMDYSGFHQGYASRKLKVKSWKCTIL